MYTRQAVHDIINNPIGYDCYTQGFPCADRLRVRVLYPEVYDYTLDERDALFKFIVIALDVMSFASSVYPSNQPQIQEDRYKDIYQNVNGLLHDVSFARGGHADHYDGLTNQMSKIMNEMKTMQSTDE